MLFTLLLGCVQVCVGECVGVCVLVWAMPFACNAFQTKSIYSKYNKFID